MNTDPEATGSESAAFETRDAYPLLRNMMSGYFYQSADLEEPDSDTIVRNYRDSLAPEDAAEMAAEVAQFLKRYGGNEERLAEAFQAIFQPETDYPSYEGRTTGEALRRIIEIMTGPYIAGKV